MTGLRPKADFKSSKLCWADVGKMPADQPESFLVREIRGADLLLKLGIIPRK